jgi:hypothetical protein
MGARDTSNAEQKNIRRLSTESSARDLSAQREKAGLCADCVHSRQVQAKRGAKFYLCGLSATDPSYPKYPRLPVLECSGYAARA